MSKVKQFREGVFGKADVRQYGMVFSLIAIITLFYFTTDGVVLNSVNLINVVAQYSYILILAIGMVMVIIAGHIDLSVGSVAAFTGICVAKSMADWGIPWPLGIAVGIGVGILVGAWQGFWVSRVMVPAFIVTLAGMLIFRGLNQVLGQSATVPVPEGFKIIGRGYIPQIGPNLILGNGTRIVNTTTLVLGMLAVLWVVWLEFRKRAKARSVGDDVPPLWATAIRLVLLGGVIMFFAFKFSTGNDGTGFPISGVILLVLVFIYSFIMRNTTFGRHVYAVGGNKRAAALSGVSVQRVNFLVIANMGMLASLAGMIYIARAGASGPQDGVGWELDAIAAVFIGGAAVTGGVGTVVGSMVGGLVMAFLNNGLSLMGVGQDWVSVIKGLVLLAAVAFDLLSKSQDRPQILPNFMRRRKQHVEVAASIGAVEDIPAEPVGS
ncbi:MAG: multiple monosaccharide ABC transporter permease [Candidatus Nanopelagicales bacterium]